MRAPPCVRRIGYPRLQRPIHPAARSKSRPQRVETILPKTQIPRVEGTLKCGVCALLRSYCAPHWKILKDFARKTLTLLSSGINVIDSVKFYGCSKCICDRIAPSSNIWFGQAVYARLGKPLPHTSPAAPNPLVVNVSARHCHLTPEAVEALFGKGHKLQVHKWLYQDGQFAAQETVTLIGPRSRVISNLRILGPCRNLNQVELAYTDAIALGFDIPLRASGEHQGHTWRDASMGPAGFFEMSDGVIRAAAPCASGARRDAEFYGVKHGDFG